MSTIDPSTDPPSPTGSPAATSVVVLASASPRRAELLRRVGLTLEIDPAQVDETPLPGEHAVDHVRRVALAKARAVAPRHRGRVVVAADTAVVLDGVPLGKPADAQQAWLTLDRLAGRIHEVVTVVMVVATDGSITEVLDSARVRMADASAEEISWYVRTGEPMDKAGSYALQGAGALLVESIDGDPTTVIGLPLRPTLRLLRGLGVAWPTSAGT